MSELGEIAAELLAADNAEAALAAPQFDRRSLLHPKQLEFVDCESDLKSVLGGRQGGKSYVFAWLGIDGMLSRPGTTQTYLGLTQPACRMSVWPEVEAICEAVGIPKACVHRSTTSVELPDGSAFYCRGTDDKRAIENLRGAKPYRWLIDEMGSQDEAWVKYLVQQVLPPSLIKQRGHIVLGGTPGLICEGYWHDLSSDERGTGGPPLFRWTAWDNPGLGFASSDEVDEYVDKQLETHGLTRESSLFIREWQARWHADLGALVYPYEHSRNGLEKLPTVNRKGRPLHASGWRYAIGVDPAAVGITGFGVVACHPDLIGAVVIRTESHAGMEVEQVAERVRELKAEFPGAVVIMDVGGLGSTHALSFTRRFGIGFIAAEKSERHSAIRWVHDMLCSGTLKVLDWLLNDAVRSEWIKLGWDSKQLDTAPGKPNHISDAVMYALRYLHAYVTKDHGPDTKLPASSAEQFAIDEAAEEEREERVARRRAKNATSW